MGGKLPFRVYPRCLICRRCALVEPNVSSFPELHAEPTHSELNLSWLRRFRTEI